MNDVRWAVMGTGRIAVGVLPKLLAARGCTLHAVASRDVARARDVALQAGLDGPRADRAACTYEGLVDRADIDAVYVTLLNHLHFEWCLKLLRSGKHVLCEKPLVATAREARDLAAAAQARGVCCVEGFMWMHHPQTTRLLELATDPASPIGPLRRIVGLRNVRTTDAYILRTRLSHAMQGGALMDIGCYPVSAGLLLSGSDPEPATLRASADWAPPQPGESASVDESIAFAWTFKNGVAFEGQASFTKGSTGAAGEPPGVLLKLVGDRGEASTTFPFSPDPDRQVLIVAGREEVIERGGDRFTNQFEAFARSIRGEAPPMPSIEWSIRQASTMEMIREAIGLRF